MTEERGVNLEEGTHILIQHPNRRTPPKGIICLAQIRTASLREKAVIVNHLRAQKDYLYEPEYDLYAFSLDNLETVFNFVRERDINVHSVVFPRPPTVSVIRYGYLEVQKS